MSSCCCSLAGTAACRTCSNNPFAETPPPVRTYTVSATDPVLITGQKTNADRIRAMSDEELADYLFARGNCQEYCYGICDVQDECDDLPSDEYCIRHIVKWLKKEVEE